MGYSIQFCFEKYAEKSNSRNESPVSVDKYRRIFTEDYSVRFKGPKSDTFHSWDGFSAAIMHSKEINEVNSLDVQQELHQTKAETGQNELSKSTNESNKNNNVHVITFDLQQNLSTPKLTTGPMFYKREIWC